MQLKRGLLIFFIALIFNPLYSQQSESTIQITKSTDKVKIDGKFYYIHIVRKGESLYSISKAYGVSQMEIAMENADIYLGIKVDQALKIPAKDIPKQGEDDKYIYHIVKKGETLFGLSKLYQISIDDIVKVNPDVQSGIILSQVLLIPREKINSINQGDQKDSGMYIYHQVKPKEGLYSISKLYNVSIQTIEDLNKDVLSNGLKSGSVLKIPQKTVVSMPTTATQQAEINKTQQSTKNDVYTTPRVKCDTFNYRRSKRVFNISLFLPLLPEKDDVDSTDINSSDTENNVEKPSETERISSKAHNFLDFYQGFLLAADSLKRDGVSLNISVYNTSKNIAESKKLLTQKGVKESDLIIGPVYPELLQPFADFSRDNRINIVSPLSQNDDLLKGNPYYFQVNPSTLVQFGEFVSKVDFCTDKNLMVVYEDDSSTVDVSNKYKNLIKNRINQCENSESIHFKELMYKPGGITPEFSDKLNQSMTDQKENVFIIPSESEAFVSDFLSHLFALTTYYNYNVKVYGFPKWLKFKNVPIDYYYRLNLHLFTPYYVNYQRKDVKNFVDDYRHYYRSEASQYSFQGYDIGLYFLKALKNYGVDFKYCLPNLKVNLLQSDYRFVQQGSIDGFDNKSVFLIHYTQDFDIQESEDQL
jgi:LysM repeat protein/ABC-type branched-subunit amino acid transport system substrate-binding protein